MKTRDLRGYFRYLGANVCHRTPVLDCACAAVQPRHTSIVSEQKEGWVHVYAVRRIGVCCFSDVYEHLFLDEIPGLNDEIPFAVNLEFMLPCAPNHWRKGIFDFK